MNSLQKLAISSSQSNPPTLPSTPPRAVFGCPSASLSLEDSSRKRLCNGILFGLDRIDICWASSFSEIQKPSCGALSCAREAWGTAGQCGIELCAGRCGAGTRVFALWGAVVGVGSSGALSEALFKLLRSASEAPWRCGLMKGLKDYALA